MKTADEILKKLGVCCDGGTAERLHAASEVLTAYAEQAAEILFLRGLKIVDQKIHEQSDKRHAERALEIEGLKLENAVLKSQVAKHWPLCEDLCTHLSNCALFDPESLEE